jgi:uncharacterized protein YijF (DUF1287 family)
MGRRKRRAIKSFVLRDNIPGIHAEGLIQSREVPAVVAEKSRAALMLGARNLSTRSYDTAYRDLGIPIFDVNAGQQQLADMLRRGESS